MKGPGRVVPDGVLGVGMQLPVQARSQAFAAPWETGSTVANLGRIVRACDHAGFLYVGVCDHIAIPQAAAEVMGTDWFDTVATLGWIAAQTETVRLLSHVYVPAHRHPLAVAKAFATLDALSEGRAVLGVGAGHLTGEFAALGTSFADRGELLDEAVTAIDAVLTEPYPAVEGPTWTVGGVTVGPRCVQSPRLPIWVAGSSRAALRRAAAVGDGWLPQATTPEELPDAVRFLHDERLRIHGDGAAGLDVGSFAQRMHIGTDHSMVKGATLCGSGDELAATLRPNAAAGATHVQVSFFSRDAAELEDQILAFGAGVLPHLVDL